MDWQDINRYRQNYSAAFGTSNSPTPIELIGFSIASSLSSINRSLSSIAKNIESVAENSESIEESMRELTISADYQKRHIEDILENLERIAQTLKQYGET